MIQPIADLPLQLKARIAGSLYLFIIIGGFFAVGYIPATILVSDDVIATMQNILTNESLYRQGFAIHVVVALCNIPLAVMFYDVFKVANKTLARILVLFILVAVAIEGSNLINSFAPLVILQNSHYASVMTMEQIVTQANIPLVLQDVGFNISLIFVGCYCIVAGFTTLRARLLPRLAGILLIAGGSCYILHGFATFVAPELATSLFPYVLIPSFLGEASLCLSLLIKGVNIEHLKNHSPELA